MIGLKAEYGGGGDLVRRFRQIRDRIENGNEQIIRNAMQEGAEIMREMIATRPSKKSGKTGRIETREMIGAVSWSANPGTAKGNTTGRFGWIGKVEPYFLYQEGGFTHNYSGEFIEGMYAMQDAGDYIINRVKEQIRENLRGA